ncbi:hypothetical protein [Acrocarpospora pleiomorpha]|nr:hypothetical protein [Acrocarpospora pleiomorpha]
MLFPTPALSREDDQVVADIEAMRHELRHQLRSTPAKWTEGLQKFLTADAVAASNSIEGFRVSTVDVEDLMDGERDLVTSEVLTPVGRTRARMYVAGPCFPERALGVARMPMTLTDPYRSSA